MAQEIPVYVFTGFMDSGKTSLVQETLFENEFGEGAKGVIIMCEDGEKEYDEAKLATVNFKLTGIENEEDFTEERLQQINDEYLPEQVFIEYNGTWGMDKLLEAKLPKLDCGPCGAPSCKALAEDIVRGFASIHDCMFVTRNEYA